MRISDRVQLTDHVAATLKRDRALNGRNQYTVDWLGRAGTVKKIGHSSIGVQWDGRKTLDWWAEKALKVLP